MKRLLVATVLVLLGAGAAHWWPALAESADLLLLDGPRGAWLGTLRSDAPLTVLEERDGWRRVRVEGWIATAHDAGPGASATRSTLPPTGAPAASSAGSVSGGGATVRGVLLAGPDDPSGTPGAGLIVLLVSDLEALDREHEQTGSECRARLDRVDQTIADLRERLNRALNAHDNFREAATSNDRLNRDLERTQRDRDDLLRGCWKQADALFQKYARQRTISDAAGRFEFTGVPQGRYRVVATAATGNPPAAWSMECRVGAGGTLVLDPRVDRSSRDPYWGLRPSVTPSG
jgi:hypothetical protein